jgi:dolichol-phosphate mannosyltransferase
MRDTVSQKISVVIPTYNESQNIVSLIKKISETMAESTLPEDTTTEIIVVDDNSPDGTAAACRSAGSERCPVKVIVRANERGLGSAVRRGILEAAGDTIVVMDADFSHDCAMIPELALAVNGGPIDVAIASRFAEGGKMSSSTHLLLGSRMLNAFLRTVLALPVRDVTGGFIALRRDCLQDMDSQRIFSGYGDYCIALLYKGFRRGWRLKEIPFTYNPRQVGLSKTRFFKTGVSYGMRALKLRMGLE